MINGQDVRLSIWEKPSTAVNVAIRPQAGTTWLQGAKHSLWGKQRGTLIGIPPASATLPVSSQWASRDGSPVLYSRPECAVRCLTHRPESQRCAESRTRHPALCVSLKCRAQPLLLCSPWLPLYSTAVTLCRLSLIELVWNWTKESSVFGIFSHPSISKLNSTEMAACSYQMSFCFFLAF